MFDFTRSGGRVSQSAGRLAASVVVHGLVCLLLFVPWISSHAPSPAVAERRMTLLAPVLERPVLPPKVQTPRVERYRPVHPVPTATVYPELAPAPVIVTKTVVAQTVAPQIKATPVIEISKAALPEVPRVPATVPAIKASGFEESRPATAAPKPVVRASGFQNAEGPASGAPASHIAVGVGSFGTVSEGAGARVRHTSGPSGFSDASASTTNGARQGSVTSGSFGDTTVDKGARQALRPTDVAVLSPVEILSKPKPAYTEEARAKKIEGEVLLEMQFSASGEARVLRVVRGLGYGLNETALTAAQGIRFRPAMRDGGPVDSAAIVHIVFQLAN